MSDWLTENDELRIALVRRGFDVDQIDHRDFAEVLRSGSMPYRHPHTGVIVGDHIPAPRLYEPLDAVTSSELRRETALELDELPEPSATDLLVGPLVIRGARTIIVADTGHGKTTLALQLAAAALDGEEVVGYQGPGAGPVLIVDVEQGLRSIKRALRDAGLARREDVHYVRAPDGLTLDKEGGEHRFELERHVAELCPALLILDPYYKAHRGDPDGERPVVDLMRYLDGLRSRYGFALILPAHPRKDPMSREKRKLTLHDVAGSGAVTRGAEVVFAIERLSDGYSRLRFLKDRDGDLPVGEAWGLLFERGAGFRRDPNDTRQPRDLLGDLVAWVAEHPRSTTNTIAEGVSAGKGRVSEILKGSGQFTFEPGPNRSRLWVTRDAQNHPDHPTPLWPDGGGPAGDPSLEGHPQDHPEACGFGAPDHLVEGFA